MLELDHIVIATPDMDESISQYGNKFAIKAIKGGEHEAWGTYNYLSFFSNNGYLEFLGIDDLEKAKDAENPLIDRKSTRLNSSHVAISYAVFCLKKKKQL